MYGYAAYGALPYGALLTLEEPETTEVTILYTQPKGYVVNFRPVGTIA